MSCFILAVIIYATMRVLIVAATQPEAGPLIAELGFERLDLNNGQTVMRSGDFTLLVTGAGMVATAFALGRHLATHRYDLAVNMGIAGSFDRSIALGQVCEITQDTFIELGAEDDEAFITIDELGFGESSFAATHNLPSGQLKKVSAATVNTVHGNEASIEKLANRTNAQLESMEGAAFFYACKQFNLPCAQIRAVSNYVEKRNRAAWQIGPAIKNLNTFVANLLNTLL